MSADGLDHYLDGIGRVSLLTPQQEVELGRTVQAGLAAEVALADQAEPPESEAAAAAAEIAAGEAAQKQLAEANLRLVVYMAKGYVGRGVSMADLVQEGNLALLKAVRQFRPERGFRFSTYAGTWIRHALVDAVAAVKRSPSLEEACSGEEPLHERLAGDAGSCPEEVVLRRLHDAEIRYAICDALKDVADERIRLLLRMRFGLEDGEVRTLAKLSKTFGVSGERLRQIEQRALSKLRCQDHGSELEELLNEL